MEPQLPKKSESKMKIVSMRLDASEFDLIKSGKKIVEIRLLDEKRRKLKIGDNIEFSKRPEEKEKILCKIVKLGKQKSFLELLDKISVEKLGYSKNYTKNKILERVYKTYSKEDEKKYGVLGIEIELEAPKHL